MVSGCAWAWGAGSALAIVCGVEAAGTLEAGSTPSKPFPVPWLAGCGGISALATSALEVSGTSGRAGDIELVIGVADWAEPAEANFICPALICTVLTLTGFIGSDDPGITAMGWV